MIIEAAKPRPQPRRSGAFTFCYSKFERPGVGREAPIRSYFVWGGYEGLNFMFGLWLTESRNERDVSR